MVNSAIDDNPLDPNIMQQRNSLIGNSQKPTQAHKLSDLDMIVDRNVAPSPQAMCAELAHEHALEDLHKITEHSPEQNDPARGPVYSQNYLEHATQYEPRKLEE